MRRDFAPDGVRPQVVHGLIFDRDRSLDLTAVRNCLSACGSTRRVGIGVTSKAGSSVIDVSARSMTCSEIAFSCAK